jgi:hypothetical protein
LKLRHYNWAEANDVRGQGFEHYIAAMQLLFQGELQTTSLAERLMLIVSMG